MLLALLYHKIGNGKYANSLSMLSSHFEWIAHRYPTVLPGDSLTSGINICLTFDDAFFDFYHLIFPLLKAYKLKAVLSVPTAYIPESTSLFSKERLNLITPFSDKASSLPSPSFCTWDELKALSDSPLIHIASHSAHHVPLTSPHVDIAHEVLTSKEVLESKLKIPITTFVYPYGRFNSRVHTLAKKHYSYMMRIGNAFNYSWHHSSRLFYRINADHLPYPHYPFSPIKYLKYSARFFLNYARRK